MYVIISIITYLQFCMHFLYAVFGYKHFLTIINDFRWLCYFWRQYTTFDGYKLLSTVIYYF